MAKHNLSPGFPVEPKEFPDTTTCQVRYFLGIHDIHECLSRWAAVCPNMILFGKNHICLHPDVISGSIRPLAVT